MRPQAQNKRDHTVQGTHTKALHQGAQAQNQHHMPESPSHKLPTCGWRAWGKDKKDRCYVHSCEADDSGGQPPAWVAGMEGETAPEWRHCHLGQVYTEENHIESLPGAQTAISRTLQATAPVVSGSQNRRLPLSKVQ